MHTAIADLEQAQIRSDIPGFRPGDTLKVHVRVVEGSRSRIQVFQGVVIRRQGGGARETFTVRKISYGVGVERTFPVHSPSIDKIEVVTPGPGAPGQAVLPPLAARQGGPDQGAPRAGGALGQAHRLVGRGGSGQDSADTAAPDAPPRGGWPDACPDSAGRALQGHPGRAGPALGSDPMMNDDQDGHEQALTEAGRPGRRGRERDDAGRAGLRPGADRFADGPGRGRRPAPGPGDAAGPQAGQAAPQDGAQAPLVLARAAGPDRDRAGHRAADQDLRGPGVLHPVVLDGEHARHRRQGPGQQAGLRLPLDPRPATSWSSTGPGPGIRFRLRPRTAPTPWSGCSTSTLDPLYHSVLGLFGTAPGQQDYIKRVIGVPGDHVACCTPRPDHRQRRALHEKSYLFPGNRPSTQRFSITVPPGRLWVMGDHRSVS